MVEAKEMTTIIPILVNLLVVGVVIYSSTKIKTIKNDYSPDEKNSSYQNVSYTEQQIFSEKEIFFMNNSFSFNETKILAKEENESISDKISKFFTNTHLPLLFTGICSSFFVIMLFLSYLVDDKDYSCKCAEIICTSEKHYHSYHCFYCCPCGVGNCCSCRDCDCDCDCNGLGNDKDAFLYIILLIVFFLIIMIFYYATKALGKSLSRIFAMIFLILFEVTFIILDIFQGINDEMNIFFYLIIVFASIGILCNLIAMILKCLNKTGYLNLSYSLFESE